MANPRRHMQTIGEILDTLRLDWAVGRRVREEGDSSVSQLLACFIREPIQVTGDLRLPDGLTAPPALADVWRACDGAELFKDIEHGQWGLRLLSPSDAVQATQQYFREDSRAAQGDFVVGQFIGDGELLLVRAIAGAPDFGRVIVVDEIDKRINWPIAAENLRDFLDEYARKMGRKFWLDDPVYLGGSFSG